jgi:hypothetical protein
MGTFTGTPWEAWGLTQGHPLGPPGGGVALPSLALAPLTLAASPRLAWTASSRPYGVPLSVRGE